MLFINEKYKPLNSICNETSKYTIDEENNMQILLYTYNDAIKWLNKYKHIKNDIVECGHGGFITTKQIQQLYNYSIENNKPCPIIGNYHGINGSFVFRCWVGTTPETVAIFENLKNITKTSGIYRGLHNTKMNEPGVWFPTAEETEAIIAFAWNKKNKFFKSDIDNIQYTMSAMPTALNIADKFINYYYDNSFIFDKIINAIPTDCSLLKKLATYNIETTIEWQKYGRYDKKPNATPKTDLISENGYHISVKKSGGSQLMSSMENEALATLSLASKSFNYKIKTLIKQLFAKHWTTHLTVNNIKKRQQIDKQNKMLTNITTELFNDTKFKTAVMHEAATGQIKFGKKSDACANCILVWDDINFNKIQFYSIKDYISHIFNKTVALIEFKNSANKTSTVLRIKVRD